EGVRASGRRSRHRRSEPRARLQARPAQLWHRGADPPGPGPLRDPRAHQQPDEARRTRGLRPGDRRARADRDDTLRREPLLPGRQAGQARPPAHPLTVAEIQGSPRAPREGRVAVLVSRYNELVTARLLEGARECFRDKGVPEARVDVIWVPGAFELPVAAEAAAASGRYAALVALGCVVRRETPHFESVADEATLQLLYAWDLSGRPSIETVVNRVAAAYGRLPEGYDRGADLAAQAIAGLPEFDARVADATEHWRLDRVGVIERNILRLALAELAEGSTPPRVRIDEAVKLAHWFSGAKAPGIVNGVLDAVARQ